MNNSPLGMNLIPLDSWHRAQEPPCVRFRIDCVAVVECCSCGPRVWMLSVVIKRVCRVTSNLRLSAEKRPGSLMAISRFQSGVSWHFHSSKCQCYLAPESLV